jgi:hypothetical protein
MEIVKVYSPIEDKNIQKNLQKSEIWTNAHHFDELTDTQIKYGNMFEYTIKFDGLRPIVVNKVRKLQNK